MRGKTKISLLVLAMLMLAPAAFGGVVTLTFEGLQNLEPILAFYNGGLGGVGSGPGPNYGITFGATSLAIIDGDSGGTGNFANEPTPNTIAFFLSGAGVVMDVPTGFTTGFSFFYTSVGYAGSVTVWDGLGGTGNMLASVPLVANGSNCGGDPNGFFNCWTPTGVAFGGTALSVNFSGVADQIGFDNITLGASVPTGDIPEPASLVLFGSGMLVILALRRRMSTR